jgi:hypothetical protein
MQFDVGMQHLLQVNHQIPVGQLHPLGHPRGATGVGQKRNVVWGWLGHICRQGLDQQLPE